MLDTNLIDFLINYGKEGIFLILFSYLFYDTRKESKEREKELYQQLNKSNEQLDRSIEALEKLQTNFEQIAQRLDKMQFLIEQKEKVGV